MKAKIFSLMALVLCLVSCQTEPEGFDVIVGGEVDTVVTVSLPETTRANSAEGFNLDNLGNYKVRYILEISYNGKLIRDFKITDSTLATFPVRLAPNRDYTFTVWADLVTETDVENWYDADLYYNTASGLENIYFNNWTPNTEARDAWTATQTVTYTSSNKNIGMELKRPFAKVRVVATDIAEIRKFGIEPTNAVATYAQEMYTEFDAVAGAAKGTTTGKTHTFNYASVDTYEGANGEQLTVFADYVLVPADGNVQFSLSVFDNTKGANALIKENNFNTTIPVVKNKVTSIVGNVLTEGGNVSITVDGALGEGETIHYVEASNAAELQEAINESTEETVVVLSGDIVLGATPTTLATRSASNNSLTIAEGVTTVIDLNGKRISTVEQSTGRHYYAIYNYGNLTIKDSGENGAIVSRGIYNYGTMTLESGKIDACDANGGYAVKNEPNATFVMNGGSVVTSYEDGDAPTEGYDATTIRNDEGATATFNGGVVNNISNYTFALDNAGTVTVNAGTFTSVHSTVSTYGTMIINGGTFTCDGLEGISAHALVAWDGSETTINGGTFDGKDNYNGFNIDACEGAVVNIYGGNFLPVHSGSLYGEGTINVMGGTFFDDPSARVVTGYKVAKNEEGNYTVAELVLNATFAQNDWSDIVFACENNRVPETWNVGDTKAMTIAGKEYQIRVLGKNHDTYTAGGTAPLTFQIAEVCGSAAMNATQTNTTGWSGSQMRTVTMPEILAAMPVKDAIKAVNKETLNGTRDGLETTSDKLFLLSEVEVNGSVFFSNNFAEGKRYEFFTDVDSMKSNATYWLRGPGKNNDFGFTQINGSGYMANGSAEYACGVVFGFCF